MDHACPGIGLINQQFRSAFFFFFHCTDSMEVCIMFVLDILNNNIPKKKG